MKKHIERIFNKIESDDLKFPFLVKWHLSFLLLSATLGSALGYKYEGKTFLSAFQGFWMGLYWGWLIGYIIRLFFMLIIWLFPSILKPLWRRFDWLIILILFVTVPLMFGIFLSRFL